MEVSDTDGVLLMGVRHLDEVTARVHTFHPSGGVSSWTGSGCVSLGRD